ncbi:MAG: hypothetical protein GX896_05495 [Clostridiales bacterium]|nr:hypothetical protein [Clostridiales bacterium]
MQLFYKAKGKFNILGTILIAVSVAVVGCLVSYVYLFINNISPLIVLCVLTALGFGLLLGLVGAFFVKIFKITNPLCAVIGVIIGCLIFTYFKWALYVSNDYNDNIYENFKSISLSQYYYNFFHFYNEDGSLMTDEDIDEVAEYLQSTKAVVYYNDYYEGGSEAYVNDYGNLNDFTLTDLEVNNIYEFLGYDTILDDDDIPGSLKAAINLDSYYDYYFNYLGNEPVTLISCLKNPTKLWNDIKEINAYGRWTIGSSSSSSTYNNTDQSQNNRVKGIFLWLTWIGEIFIICIPAIWVAHDKASKPFISFENKWAKKYRTSFKLQAPNNYNAFKGELIYNSNAINNLAPELITRAGIPFIEVTLFHSSTYTENYITVTYRVISRNKNNNNNNTSIVLAKYLKISQDTLYKMFRMFGYEVPFTYTPDPNAQYESSNINDIIQPADFNNSYNTDNTQVQSPSTSTNMSMNDMFNSANLSNMPINTLNQQSTQSIEELQKNEPSSDDVFDELNK